VQRALQVNELVGPPARTLPMPEDLPWTARVALLRLVSMISRVPLGSSS
jgi:hypothetical protein